VSILIFYFNRLIFLVILISAIGSAVILPHPLLLLKNVQRAGRMHSAMDHSILPFSKSVVTLLLYSDQK